MRQAHPCPQYASEARNHPVYWLLIYLLLLLLIYSSSPNKSLFEDVHNAASLSDALATYCSLKGADRTALFFTAAKRNVGYVLEHLGDRPIDTYSSADAASFRDWLIDRGLTTSSISRIFGTIRAVINLTIQEQGLDCRNAFANIYLIKKAEEKRKPIPKHEIIQIQKTCLEFADERRLSPLAQSFWEMLKTHWAF